MLQYHRIGSLKHDSRPRSPTTFPYPSSEYSSVKPDCSQSIDLGDPAKTVPKSGIYASQSRFRTSPEIENTAFEEYQFLHHDLLSLSSEDKAFLFTKGSFSLPSRELATYFVEKFFQRIQPVAPVIDEAQFWSIWEGRSEEKFSLFVFQSLLFASCPVRYWNHNDGPELPDHVLTEFCSLSHLKSFKSVDIPTREMPGNIFTREQR
jgi:hypothetical protein